MAIITLTTDFGEKDYFAGAVKGAIYNELSDVRIVDISHSVSPFHISEASYIIKNAYKSFPKGSIHIIGIDSELTPENKHLAVKLDDHYFICANNGILSLLASEIRPEKIVEINIHDKIQTNFPVLDVFVKVACHISRGGTLEVIGKNIEQIKHLKQFEPIINSEKNQILGHVIYIDNYGNVITNISRKLFESTGKGRPFKISARRHNFDAIYETYSHAINFEVEKENRKEEDGKKLAVFNSAGYIELAIYKSNPNTVGGAASLFGLEYLDTVTINFE
ncbi:SAM-dependent chlorinase/fluorinase [Christiangramia sp. OXR-203]|jgi:S-adenosylmethionine hydrolase|uniref:SAM hydrolase/SAM-dependent halogenase family protein n=1 Tax=unclassified Christiangramia TaxID=2615027 RepID=UPI002AC90DE0|nr:SAM-dependent chlorinase/fluorinase [Christiangramia sp. OXR-203]WPY99881.1 SAM-dependent chlorinase/fluorinase [Christiangramia sp. OXR-203]|tara:strand:- start:16 stop:849 length:834 start_codon:yes stop_codon:yes gene_type:complete